jgi:hypothetical protein
MTLDEYGHAVAFASTGRKLYMAMPEIGIDPKGAEPVCGYDDGPRIDFGPLPQDRRASAEEYARREREKEFTPEERRELAEWAISLWEKYGGIEPQQKLLCDAAKWTPLLLRWARTWHEQAGGYTAADTGILLMECEALVKKLQAIK